MTNSPSRPSRQDRRIRELDHDPYKSKRKLSEPTVCPDCSAVYRRGRWQWGERPSGAREVRCPACERTQDKYPAGQVTISGTFLDDHREEILNLVRNQEQRAKEEHALERIMEIEEGEDSIIVKTTDIHLPRAIGEALHRAYEGELDYRYNEEEYYLDVRWTR